jgi:glycosyltransferase involved in cell wall biosynthesis
MFFDEERRQAFIDQEFPEYRKIFDSFQLPIQRYDFFRYLAIYRYGGFYFDLDVILASGISDLLEFSCVFAFEALTINEFLRDHYNMDWEIGNYAFGAAAGHPFLEAIIVNCIRAQKDPGWVRPMMLGLPYLSRASYLVLNTTGPALVSRTLAENPELAKTVKILFPEDVCDVSTWNRFGDFGVHFREGSWRTRGNYIHRRLAQRWEGLIMKRLLKHSRKLGKTRQHVQCADHSVAVPKTYSTHAQEPLVSILIPAFNAQESIGDTLRSATAQTWRRKEVIVIDDGSTDQTLRIARQFESQGVRVYSKRNESAAATRNFAFLLSQGDYIQWLDADDLLAPDKIALQMNSLRQHESKRVLLSSAWGRFIYRHNRTEFIPTALWCDLSPLEWLLRKMGDNLFMQTASWLVSRELTEAAGPWDARLLSDDDGEYFCRVLLAGNGVRFIPEAKAYYRGPSLAFRGLSYIGHSSRKLDAHWLSMRLHIDYIRSIEDSERTRTACLRYLQTSLIYFYPDKPDIVAQAKQIARDLGGQLVPPHLPWKYSWMRRVFGWRAAKSGQRVLLRSRWSVERGWDKALFHLGNGKER